MILLTEPKDINKFFDALDDITTELYPDDIAGVMAPKFIVLKCHSVEAMLEGITYLDAGRALHSLGYDFVMPMFKELPDAINASQNFRYPIAVVGLKERAVLSGDCSISER